MATRKGTARERERVATRASVVSGRRHELLDALRARSEPRTAGELAKAFSLHVSTVRFHLDALIDSGAVTAEFERKPVRGRPRRLYSASTPAEPVGYQTLAEVLASQWGTPGSDPAERAVEAGRQWALSNVGDDATTPHTLADAAADVSALFEGMGFGPEARTDGDEAHIRLHACPFEAVARKSPGVVCALHLGLLRGVLERAGVPDVEGELTPWETPDTCVARVYRR